MSGGTHLRLEERERLAAQGRGAQPAGDRAGARPGGLDRQPRAAAERAAERRLPAGARRGLLPRAAAAAVRPGARRAARPLRARAPAGGVDAGADRGLAQARRGAGAPSGLARDDLRLPPPPRAEGREALEAAAARAGQARPAAGSAAARHHRRAAFHPRPARGRPGAEGPRALGGRPADLPPDAAGAGPRGAEDPLRARRQAGRQVGRGDRGRHDGGLSAARPAPAVLDHLRQRHRVRPPRAAGERLLHGDLVLRRLRVLAERPCSLSSLLPGGAGAQHGVERHHQLAHAGRERELGGLPRPTQPLVEGRDRRVGAPRAAATAAMYRQARRVALPPPTVRLPRILPLSRLNGATPTRAAAWRRVSEPSSGSSASRVRALTGPTPGTERSSSSLARQAALSRTAAPRSRSIPASASSSQRRWASIPSRRAGSAARRRLRSATSIPSSWRRRATRAPRRRVASSGKGRAGGRTASAKRAIVSASRRSVFASRPVARAKARPRRGSAATGSPAAARAAARPTSRPPVASSTTSVGARAARRSTSAAIPSSSWSIVKLSPEGREWTSSRCLETSMPTKVRGLSMTRLR